MKEVGLGEFCSNSGITLIYNEIDANGDHIISQDELSDQFYNNFITRSAADKYSSLKNKIILEKTEEVDEDEEEEEHIPDDLKDLDPETRTNKAIVKSL